MTWARTRFLGLKALKVYQTYLCLNHCWGTLGGSCRCSKMCLWYNLWQMSVRPCTVAVFCLSIRTVQEGLIITGGGDSSVFKDCALKAAQANQEPRKWTRRIHIRVEETRGAKSRSHEKKAICVHQGILSRKQRGNLYKMSRIDKATKTERRLVVIKTEGGRLKNCRVMGSCVCSTTGYSHSGRQGMGR